jgi:hypothetical protein
MEEDLDPSLLSTERMLRQAYPEGIPDAEYLALIRAMYDHLSDRNLALVLSVVSGRDSGEVLNDIYRAASIGPDSVSVRAVIARLQEHGYDAWLSE